MEKGFRPVWRRALGLCGEGRAFCNGSCEVTYLSFQISMHLHLIKGNSAIFVANFLLHGTDRPVYNTSLQDGQKCSGSQLVIIVGINTQRILQHSFTDIWTGFTFNNLLAPVLVSCDNPFLISVNKCIYIVKQPQ